MSFSLKMKVLSSYENIFFMVIFANVFSPKAASQQPLAFGDPRLLTMVNN